MSIKMRHLTFSRNVIVFLSSAPSRKDYANRKSTSWFFSLSADNDEPLKCWSRFCAKQMALNFLYCFTIFTVFKNSTMCVDFSTFHHFKMRVGANFDIKSLWEALFFRIQCQSLPPIVFCCCYWCQMTKRRNISVFDGNGLVEGAQGTDLLNNPNVNCMSQYLIRKND